MQGRRIALGVIIGLVVLAVLDLWVGGPLDTRSPLFRGDSPLDRLVRVERDQSAPGGGWAVGPGVPRASRTGSLGGGAATGAAVAGLDRLELRNRMGDVRVEAWQRSEVADDYEIIVYADTEAQAASYLERLSVEGRAGGAAYTVSLEGDEPGRRPRGVRAVEVDHRVSVPARFGADLETSYGSLDVTGLSGDVRARDGYGPMTLSRLGGAVTAHNSFGRIDVDDVAGRAEIDISYEGASVRQVRGDLDITSRFGKVDVHDVGGDVSADAEYGACYVGSVGGDARISNRFGEVQSSGVRGATEVRVSYGPVRLEDLVADVRVDSRFGPVELETLPGAGYTLDLRCRRGHILGLPSGLSRISDQDREEASGRIGDGRNHMTVTAEFGNVSLDMPAR